MDIRLIVAVGRHGQIGLRGQLPWGPEIGDLAHFKSATAGGVLLLGWGTVKHIADWRRLTSGGRSLALLSREGLALIESANSDSVEAGGGKDLLNEPEAVLNTLDDRYQDRVLWIAGGEAVYRAFGPYAVQSLITHVDYDGPADRYLPSLPWMTS